MTLLSIFKIKPDWAIMTILMPLLILPGAAIKNLECAVKFRYCLRDTE